MDHVLIVDDDPNLCRSLKRVLVAEGYRVSVAGDAEIATRLISSEVFEAALVDFHLPGPDGLSVLASIRQRQPACARLLMSASLEKPLIIEAVNEGQVMRVIEKPLDPLDLLHYLMEARASVRRMSDVREAQRVAVLDSERRMLEQALGGGYIQIAIQPIVSRDEVVIGHEALLRSTHAVLDGPLALLRVAERSAMMAELEAAVCARAAQALEREAANGLLFLNIAPEQLGDPARLMASLGGVMPWSHRCVLEITERGRLQEIEGWEAGIEAATEAGFQIAVDDLGAGYNSLGVLADLQPHFIKLDMSIVRNVHLEMRKRRLVDLIATFGDATGAQVVAEGVELAEEAEALKECGIHLLQGYYFGRPQLLVPEAGLMSAC